MPRSNSTSTWLKRRNDVPHATLSDLRPYAPIFSVTVTASWAALIARVVADYIAGMTDRFAAANTNA